MCIFWGVSQWVTGCFKKYSLYFGYSNLSMYFILNFTRVLFQILTKKWNWIFYCLWCLWWIGGIVIVLLEAPVMGCFFFLSCIFAFRAWALWIIIGWILWISSAQAQIHLAEQGQKLCEEVWKHTKIVTIQELWASVRKKTEVLAVSSLDSRCLWIITFPRWILPTIGSIYSLHVQWKWKQEYHPTHSTYYGELFIIHRAPPGIIESLRTAILLSIEKRFRAETVGLVAGILFGRDDYLDEYTYGIFDRHDWLMLSWQVEVIFL